MNYGGYGSKVSGIPTINASINEGSPNMPYSSSGNNATETKGQWLYIDDPDFKFQNFFIETLA
jgi:hypothetical protein